MNKKGVELTLSTIVVAVILLIVLAVVSYIFFSEAGDFQEGLNACDKPVEICKATCPIGEIPVGTDCAIGEDKKPTGVCCRALNGNTSTANALN